MSDLIVIGYPDKAAAQNVWDDLVKPQYDYLVDLEDAAIIRRDRSGKLHVATPDHHMVACGTFSGLFWGVLIGLLFLGAAGNLGINNDFRQRVQDLVQPGTSSMLVIVYKVSTGKLLDALRPYGGTVLHTSVPHDAEQQLMQALHGDDPTALTWQQPDWARATT
jgi:uncharacterized membrane protein